MRDERSLAALDQGFSESDQSAADVDQTMSDSDQTRSERDQASADHDQQAADMDRDASEGVDIERDGESRYEQTRQMRADSTLEREATSFARGHTAVARDDVARQRDQLSAARDAASSARDELAAALDLAALDRLAYVKELASAEVDEVTGALRRRVGLAALQREMDRALRTEERLTVVFVDVDGLKQVNDVRGHAAGDELLRSVVECVKMEFRPYDLILRFGGDEFVCSLSGHGVEEIDSRLERITTRLNAAIPGATIGTGVSERRPQDTVEALIGRADEAMIARRRNDRTPWPPG